MSDDFPLPVVPLHNPLTTDDEAVLDNIISVHRVLADVIERAKRSGMDMTQQEQRNAIHLQAATAFKQHFFPTPMRPSEPSE